MHHGVGHYIYMCMAFNGTEVNNMGSGFLVVEQDENGLHGAWVPMVFT